MLEQKQEKEKFDIQKLEKLEAEQRKLAKQLQLRDEIDFSLVQTIAGCDSAFIGKEIISAIVVLNTDMQIFDYLLIAQMVF